MRIVANLTVALAVAFSALDQNGGFAVQAKDSGPEQHASLQAYPDAIVSATDPASGITVSVEHDGKTIIARGADGPVLWRVNVLEQTGKPAVGFAVVRRIDISNSGAAVLTVGKHRVIEADLKTGKMKFIGED